jgi:hypothetical protein
MLRLIVNRPVPAQPFASYKSHMADLKRFREEADRLRAEGAEMKTTARVWRLCRWLAAPGAPQSAHCHFGLGGTRKELHAAPASPGAHVTGFGGYRHSLLWKFAALSI